MKIAVCRAYYSDKRLCGNIELVCKKHYRTVKIQNEFEHDCDIVFIAACSGLMQGKTDTAINL